MTYSLDMAYPKKKIFGGHLKLGGSNPQGDTISFTNYYMKKNGEPMLPIMGEFHYSRYPCRYWEEAILKVKASGLDIVSTYVFWNIHQEEEGIFDWSGNRNLRYFVELCAKHNMWTIVRIGPFCHGEIRNGGLPDWLYGKSFQVRSNDKGYLNYVRRLYNEIGRQLEGFMFKDGGPVIGIQLENEYQCSASPWALTYKDQPVEYTGSSDDGPAHMKMLKKLAIEAGLAAPIYMATGWGGAVIIEGETLPVTAAYPYPNWAKAEPSTFYRFKDVHKNPDSPARYDTEQYPLFYVEMGGGMMATYNRRPIVSPASLEALVTRALGSGANGIGYYMYHGGSTPVGKHGFMSDHASGYPNISYDFQAPLGEFGQVNDSYRYLKTLHLFINEFGPILAPMVTVLPEGAEHIKPTDAIVLRYAARAKDNSGFLFLVNFQDHCQIQDIKNIKLSLKLPDETLTVPRDKDLTLKRETSAIFPFNLSLGGVLLKYATTQPLTKIENNSVIHYFFYAPQGTRSEYAFDRSTIKKIQATAARIINDNGCTYLTVQPGTGSLIELIRTDGSRVSITTLTRQQALKCWKMTVWGRERLILSEATVLNRGEFLQLQQMANSNMTVSIYPDVEGGLVTSVGGIQRNFDGIFVSYQIAIPDRRIQLEVKRVSKNKAVVKLPLDAMEGLNDIFLKIDYVGDTGMAFIDGTLAADNFYQGLPWWIGLKRFAPEVLQKGIYFCFRPMYENAPYLTDLPAELTRNFSCGPVIDVRSTKAVPEYQVIVSRKGS